MAKIVNKAPTMVLPFGVQFNRGYKAPLDLHTTFATLEEANNYLKSPYAEINVYDGQLITVGKNDDVKLYIVKSTITGDEITYRLEEAGGAITQITSNSDETAFVSNTSNYGKLYIFGDELYYLNSSGKSIPVLNSSIPTATADTDGLMSSEDKKKIDSGFVGSLYEDQDIKLNTYNLEGVFHFKNVRITDANPIQNNGVISGILTVIKSVEADNEVFTQVLNLNNNEGGEGNIYIRSYQKYWKSWQKLQTNIEVGQVNSLNVFTDNGIYSGVLTDGTATSPGTFYETFVLIVINNYAVMSAIPGATDSSKSQLKYALSLDGKVSVKQRSFQYDKGSWSEWVDVGDELTDEQISDINKIPNLISKIALIPSENKVDVNITTAANSASTLTLPVATPQQAGIITSTDKNRLNNFGIPVTWGADSDVNNYIDAGVYNVTGERLNLQDNLPITNEGNDATIAAKLIVTVTPQGQSTYRHSIGQTLILSNAEGKETKVYTRNGNRTSYDGAVSFTIEWGAWANLQTNINVNVVYSFDNLIDNGIYSGIYSKDQTFTQGTETFVLIVINDYAISSKLDVDRRISQLKYSVLTGSEISIKKRLGIDSGNSISWGEWEAVGNQAAIDANAKAIADLKTVLNNHIFSVNYKEPKLYFNGDSPLRWGQSLSPISYTLTVDKGVGNNLIKVTISDGTQNGTEEISPTTTTRQHKPVSSTASSTLTATLTYNIEGKDEDKTKLATKNYNINVWKYYYNGDDIKEITGELTHNDLLGKGFTRYQGKFTNDGTKIYYLTTATSAKYETSNNEKGDLNPDGSFILKSDNGESTYPTQYNIFKLETSVSASYDITLT